MPFKQNDEDYESEANFYSCFNLEGRVMRTKLTKERHSTRWLNRAANSVDTEDAVVKEGRCRQ